MSWLVSLLGLLVFSHRLSSFRPCLVPPIQFKIQQAAKIWPYTPLFPGVPYSFSFNKASLVPPGTQ